ncbi:nitroreductase/quinone reductase family protein [Mycobacterium sp. MAA66]|uniref:nitroreductase/quinone reductase family protein n=1 Tax=Mycobacterium sp. MAA66 TaxID=3156297 RepID=UPI003519B9F8
MSTFQRWQFRGGRPHGSARMVNRLLGIAFAAGIGPRHAATIEVRGRKTGRAIAFPVVVVPYGGERYLVAMLGDRTNWVRNLRADNHAVLLQRAREDVSLVEDFSDDRAAILRRYLELAPGARPFFSIDRRAPVGDFEPIVDQYPVFRFVTAS